MILSIIMIMSFLNDNKWCIDKMSEEELALLGILCAIAITDTLITGLILHFIFK